ncbi:hypothetical protein [Vibrio taketomensis]|uniref:hypothetical protein n=1 Tax=Vibrio taketomensis TaxID=2572923 RepID=UPI00138A19F6|nr:hypothetical protein [Vibrio taketomensis]
MLTRSGNIFVFEAVDLFVGGNDTLSGGAGLDRMQGQYGNDFFFANFSEDVLLGDYGRFTFVESDSISSATSIISLAQGGLDLIRQAQTNLFSGYAKQVHAKSNLGEAARSRTAVTTAFTSDARQAFDNLSLVYRQCIEWWSARC